MSVLVRTGRGIADVIWKDKLAAGDKVFSRTHQWVTTVAGGSYDCLHRTGSGITDVAYSVENIPLPYDPGFKVIYDAIVAKKLINIFILAGEKGRVTYQYFAKIDRADLYSNTIFWKPTTSRDNFGTNRPNTNNSFNLAGGDQTIVNAMNTFNNISIEGEFIGKESVAVSGNPKGAFWTGANGISTNWSRGRYMPEYGQVKFYK